MSLCLLRLTHLFLSGAFIGSISLKGNEVSHQDLGFLTIEYFI